MLFKLSAIALFIVLSVSSARAAEYPGGFVPANPPVALPDFVFEDAHGQNLTLADFRGRPVLLNLWATWCGPCVQEMPSLDHLQALLQDKNLVVIALDQERDALVRTTSFFQRHDIKNLAIYTDQTGRTSSILHTKSLPMSFLVTADGKMDGFVMGSTDWDAPDMLAFIRARLPPHSTVAQ